MSVLFADICSGAYHFEVVHIAVGVSVCLAFHMHLLRVQPAAFWHVCQSQVPFCYLSPSLFRGLGLSVYKEEKNIMLI